MALSNNFVWDSNSLQKAVHDSFSYARDVLGLQFDSFSSNGEKIGEFEYVNITGNLMLKYHFKEGVSNPFTIEVSLGRSGEEQYPLVIVTDSSDFSEVFPLNASDKSAFEPVRRCIFDRLKIAKES
jgi:hypothetical protein